jgi:hypothetical protein
MPLLLSSSTESMHTQKILWRFAYFGLPKLTGTRRKFFKAQRGETQYLDSSTLSLSLALAEFVYMVCVWLGMMKWAGFSGTIERRCLWNDEMTVNRVGGPIRRWTMTEGSGGETDLVNTVALPVVKQACWTQFLVDKLWTKPIFAQNVGYRIICIFILTSCFCGVSSDLRAGMPISADNAGTDSYIQI